MSSTEQTDSPVSVVAPNGPYLVAISSWLVGAYAIAQGATVVHELVVPGATQPGAARGMNEGVPLALESLNSFGVLAGNFVAGAPMSVFLAVFVAAISVYRGQTLLKGTAFSIALMVGQVVGIIGFYELVSTSELPLLVATGLLLGVMFGGLGSLLGGFTKHLKTGN